MGESESVESPDGALDNEVEAKVGGKSLDSLPKDLYIPPDALVVFLDAFEGPLDLLLYLIRRQNLDILEIKVAEITEQYMQYIEMMSAMRLQLAGDYLVMAATLTDIKSSVLLPKREGEEEEADPRALLIRRLQEYERLKIAAEQLDSRPRMERDILPTNVDVSGNLAELKPPDVAMAEIVITFAELLNRAKLYATHEIERNTLSVRERMGTILSQLQNTSEFVMFQSLFDITEGRVGLTGTLVAILELMRQQLVQLTQSKPYDPIYIRMRRASD